MRSSLCIARGGANTTENSGNLATDQELVVVLEVPAGMGNGLADDRTAITLESDRVNGIIEKVRGEGGVALAGVEDGNGSGPLAGGMTPADGLLRVTEKFSIPSLISSGRRAMVMVLSDRSPSAHETVPLGRIVVAAGRCRAIGSGVIDRQGTGAAKRAAHDNRGNASRLVKLKQAGDPAHPRIKGDPPPICTRSASTGLSRALISSNRKTR